MARFVVGEPPNSGTLAILPSAFNPVTTAHLGLAQAAIEQARVDHVAFVLPENLPHKQFYGASFDQRLEMVMSVAEVQSVVVASGGLVYEIVQELSESTAAEIAVLCGRDAAERFISWDYGEGPSIERQLKEYRLIVADRDGRYRPPAHLDARVEPVQLQESVESVSSTSLRQAILGQEPWEHMTPEPVAQLIRRFELYCCC